MWHRDDRVGHEMLCLGLGMVAAGLFTGAKLFHTYSVSENKLSGTAIMATLGTIATMALVLLICYRLRSDRPDPLYQPKVEETVIQHRISPGFGWKTGVMIAIAGGLIGHLGKDIFPESIRQAIIAFLQ